MNAQTLAAQHAESLLKSIRARVDAGAPFGHTDDMGAWHDIDECPEDCPGGAASAFDYMADVLDIHYMVNADRTYHSARLLIGFGGPNVWIDTRTRQLEVYWGSSSESRELPGEFIDEVDNAAAELWEMGA